MLSFATASFIGLSAVASLASAAPFTFNNNPLNNGFPNIAKGSTQQTAIEQTAHGSIPIPAPTTPGAAPPAKVSVDTLTSLRFIAFNELFEVAFFTSLIQNITADVDGFKISNSTAKKNFLDDLTAIQAQEELHVLNANFALAANGAEPIKPCEYVFPTTKLGDAIELASTFTDVVLATLPDIQTNFAIHNDSGLIRGVGAVIGQEGEQNGFYRQFTKNSNKIPSALPFLTQGTRNLAFNALNQTFVVPGSCPNIGDLTADPSITTLAPLTVKTNGGDLAGMVQTVDFTVDLSAVAADKLANYKGPKNDYAPLVLVYLNQANAPTVITPVFSPDSSTVVPFKVNFPFNAATFGNGLTLAVLAPAGSDFSSVASVSAVAVAGPALIEVN